MLGPKRNDCAPSFVQRHVHRNLQRQWRERASAGVAALVEDVGAGHCMSSGTQGAAGALSSKRFCVAWLQRDLARPKELERRCDPVSRRSPCRKASWLARRSGDLHSRYIEAEIDGLTIGCLYLPNGNPAPGPKFDYKLAWFDRLAKHAKKLLASGKPVVLAGDFNAVPTELDAYKPERWVHDAVFFPQTREAYRRLVAQGWTDSLRETHPGEVIYTYWDYFRNAFGRNAGLRMDHLLLSPVLKPRLQSAGVDREVRGWEKTSDHAPTWVRLADKPVKRKSPAAPRGKR
jgi:exodeoxyribonuclease III